MARLPSILAVLLLTTVIFVVAAPPGVSDDAGDAERASPAYDRDGNRIFDDLDEAMAVAAATDRIDVIVVFTRTDLAGGLRAVERVIGDVSPLFAYPSLPGVALALTPHEIKRVAALDAVRQVELDVPGTHELATSTYFIGARAVWQDLGYTGDRDGDPTTFTKDDVTIAVLDTGIHPAHLDFTGKIIGWHDTVGGQPNPFDNDGHGTHVSSIAAGRGLADEERKGVAPGASLVVVRIANKAHAAAAVEWVMANKDTYGIDIMTMSFGFGIGADGSDSLAQLFDKAFTDAGILTVKSTGNSGPNYGTMTIPGDARYILAVGSLEDPGKTGWKLATYSSRGPTTDGRIKPDIAAPGHSISAASRSVSGYVALSGTSMAAPHVAGVAALVMSANPSLTNYEVRQLLVDTAERRGMGLAPNNDYGAGLVDPYAAVQAALGATGSNPVTDPSVETWTGTAGAPSSWIWHREATDNRLALTVLLEAPNGQRGFELQVLPVGGLPFTYTHPAFGARHVNLEIPSVLTGPFVYQFSATTPGYGYSLDQSGNWPADPPFYHGEELPLPPLP